jgi:anti-sigma regulatory factor (Ser/Thr protein kinase)
VKEIALHIMDLVQNSIAAGATRVEVSVTRDSAAGRLTVEVADDGRGMPPHLADRAVDPFVTTRTTRRVGLGLPLLADSARQSGGSLVIDSVEGRGTRVTATFGLTHIDRPPLGDMASTLACLLAANPGLEVEYRHRCDGREFVLTASDVRQALDDMDGGAPGGPLVFRSVRSLVSEGLLAACGEDGSQLS